MFDWKPEYSCCIAEIDAQHKQLFTLAQKLYGLASLKDDVDRYDEITAIFTELRDYTVYHFGYEEKLLEEHGYNTSELRMHKMEHYSFISKLRKIEQADIDANQKKVLMDTIMMVVDWIEQHILVTDKKYAQFLNSRGIV